MEPMRVEAEKSYLGAKARERISEAFKTVQRRLHTSRYPENWSTSGGSGWAPEAKQMSIENGEDQLAL